MTIAFQYRGQSSADVLVGFAMAAGRAGAAPDGDLLDEPYLGEYLAGPAGCAAVWLLAYVLRANRERGAVLAERAATAERERDHLARLAAADERASIARELHDVVADSLAVMIAQADGASYAIEKDAGRAREAMRTVAGTGRDALEDMRRIVAVLRGTGEPDPSRRPAGVAELAALVERSRAAGLDVRLSVGAVGAVSPAVQLTVYRVVREALTNVLRHAGPSPHVDVDLTRAAGRLIVEVTDDGTDDGVGEEPGGNGLIGMRERVAVHGGEFAAGPRTGGGCRCRTAWRRPGASAPARTAPGCSP
nr:sensor histidine kinase [Cryptosporangium arvum]